MICSGSKFRPANAFLQIVCRNCPSLLVLLKKRRELPIGSMSFEKKSLSEMRIIHPCDVENAMNWVGMDNFSLKMAFADR